MNKPDPLEIHQREQGLAALASAAGLTLSVLRGAMDAGATPQEARVILLDAYLEPNDRERTGYFTDAEWTVLTNLADEALT